MNLLLLIFIGLGVIALIIFLAIRNLKDKKEFEHDLNNDLSKNKKGEGDVEIDEL